MANRYWVGGTATWDATAGTKWASTSGGAGGQPVPTAADDVFLDAASGVVTVSTIAGILSCRSLNCSGFTGTLSMVTSSVISIGHSTAGASNVALLLSAGMTFSFISTASTRFDFVSTSATTQTITTSGKTLTTCTINGAGSSYQLADNNTMGVGSTLTLTAGTLDTNNQTCNWSSFSLSNANTRTVTLGASAITISGTGASGWFCQNNAGLTMTANTAVVTCTAAAASFRHYGNMNGTSVIMNGGGACSIGVTGSGILTVKDFTFTGTAAKTDSITFGSAGNGPLTCTGTLTVNSNSATNRVLVWNALIGTPVTITAAALVCTNVIDFMDITGAGAATWTTAASGATYFGDCGGNSGITFTTPATQTHTASAGGNWSDVTKWTSRVPLPQDDVVVDSNTTGTLTADMPRLGKSIDFTGFTGTYSQSVAATQYGNFTLVSGMTYTHNNTAHTFGGRSTYTLTSAGKAFFVTTISMPGGTLSLADAANFGSFTTNYGNFTTNNYDVTTAGYISSANSATRTYTLGTTTWYATGTSNVFTVFAAGVTMSAASATIVLPTASGVARTFAGAGFAYGTVTYTVANSPGSLAITGANTFTTLNVGSGRILTMPSSTINTINTWNVNGAVNGYVYLPGAANNYLSAPDSAALSITGDIDIRVRLTMDNWTPVSTARVLGKRTDNSTISYELQVLPTGVIGFNWTANGSTQQGTNSGVATGLANGAAKWIRVTRNATTGDVKFYTAADAPTPGTWTQLGTTSAGATGSMFDGTQVLELGSVHVGTTAFWAGKLYRTQIRNNILDDGTGIQFDADLTTKTVGANTFTESSANAATVTINGVLAQAGDGRVSLVSSTPGTAATVTKSSGTVSSDYLTIQDSSATGASWFAGPHSVNVSNNTGWIFSGAPPARPSGFYPFFR